MIEQHPLPFFLPQNARLLMLGSFPPARKRWSMDFYYPNLQNDMWRIFGLVFFKDKEFFIDSSKKVFDKERIVGFLNEKGIALGDTARAIVRLNNNASDKYLEVKEVIDVSHTLSLLPECQAVVTTGEKATEIICSIINVNKSKLGESSVFNFLGRNMVLYRMPSSSRAYPKSLEEKALIYKRMFKEQKML
ncbi:MAG: uracil-DNA glycosylase family protein [Bacteroidales bacterium]|nr:uracil-DNA glycosylase family protein [Bacteroidales bacterium]